MDGTALRIPRRQNLRLGTATLPVVMVFILVVTVIVVSLGRSIAQSLEKTGELPVIVIVRHANKAAEPVDDPPLTDAGVKRSQELVTTLRDAGVTAIITTELRRTRETAVPLAKALGLTPEVVQRGGRGQLNEHLKALETAARRHAGGVVLVIGHDNTVPGLIAWLGGPKLPNICDPDYDNLFVLIPAKGKVHLVHSHYGESTPDAGRVCN
jgi:broad specificity phosphatase PhoE